MPGLADYLAKKPPMGMVPRYASGTANVPFAQKPGVFDNALSGQVGPFAVGNAAAATNSAPPAPPVQETPLSWPDLTPRAYDPTPLVPPPAPSAPPAFSSWTNLPQRAFNAGMAEPAWSPERFGRMIQTVGAVPIAAGAGVLNAAIASGKKTVNDVGEVSNMVGRIGGAALTDPSAAPSVPVVPAAAAAPGATPVSAPFRQAGLGNVKPGGKDIFAPRQNTLTNNDGSPVGPDSPLQIVQNTPQGGAPQYAAAQATPQMTLGQMRLLAPFIQPRLSPVEGYQTEYLGMIRAAMHQQIAAAGDDMAKRNQALVDYMNSANRLFPSYANVAGISALHQGYGAIDPAAH